MSDDSFNQMSPEELEEWKKTFSSDGVKAYETFLRNKVHQWKNISLNIRIIGNGGAGKSSFINAIRGLHGDDEGAAKVDVTEATKQPTPYSHPNNAMMKFWDLPGVGTKLFPKESYLEKIGFERFDFFLIFCHVRFTEVDAWLSEEIQKQEKQFFFVRSKVQNDIDNDRKAHPKIHTNDPIGTKKALLHQMRANIQDNLGRLYREEKVFLIDSYEPNEYDFALLAQHLV